MMASLADGSMSGLARQDRCGIYEERPLVCRIYPAEISPFITLDPADKVCPPEMWEAGEIIVSDRLVDPVLLIKIAQSRDWMRTRKWLSANLWI